MIIRTSVILAAAIAAMPCAVAEELDTEISIERQVVPEHRTANRLNLLPRLELPAVTQVRLKSTDRATAVAVPAYVSTLDPAAYGTSAEKYPWRGYASIGYFPAFNLGASAGYRIVDKEKTTVDAWLQYDGASWHGNTPVSGSLTGEDARVGLHRHTATVGADFTQRVGGKSAFDASLVYTFSNWNMPVPVYAAGDPVRDNSSLNRISMDLGWRSRPSDRFSYSVGLGYGLMDYNITRVPGPDPVENTFRLDFTGSFGLTDDLSINLAVDGDVYDYNYPKQDLVKGIAGLSPAVSWRTGKFALNAGLRFDILLDGGTPDPGDNGNVSGKIYPDIRIAWTPSGSFTLWGKMTGRSTANSFGEIYDWCRYTMPTFAFEFSSLDIDTEVGMTIGPWRGASLELRGGYASAAGWLMPVMDRRNSGVWTGNMAFSDVEGFHYGATVSYKYRSLLELRGSVDGAPSDSYDSAKGYYLWRDRARWVMDASVDIHPIEQLTITVGHHWRTGRRCMLYNSCNTEPIGNVSSLRVGAAYRITDALSVFARGENILNHRQYIMPGLPDQGVAGLIGVAYKIR